MRPAFLILALLFVLLVPDAAQAAGGQEAKAPEFVEQMKSFAARESAAGIEGIGPRLSFRAKEQPFLVVATIIFVAAILEGLRRPRENSGESPRGGPNGTSLNPHVHRSC